MVLTIPFLRGLFQFDRLHALDLMLCLAVGAVSILWFEALKLANTRKHRSLA
jgi:Ca2+-transporting ATPase